MTETHDDVVTSQEHANDVTETHGDVVTSQKHANDLTETHDVVTISFSHKNEHQRSSTAGQDAEKSPDQGKQSSDNNVSLSVKSQPVNGRKSHLTKHIGQKPHKCTDCVKNLLLKHI